MKCSDCKYLMWEYLDGSLPASVRNDMEDHLAQCPACSESLERFKKGQISEGASGLFRDLIKPSGGFKSLFLVSAIFTLILVMALVAVYLKKPIFWIF